MTSAVRATSTSHRSPAGGKSTTMAAMTRSGQSLSIFAEEGDNLSVQQADSEVRNINSFYSPIDHDDSPPNSEDFDNSPAPLIIPNPSDPTEEQLRRRCAFFFMDPIQKFIARRQAPWKLILQFGKIILITSQLLVFGEFRYAHTNYYNDNHIAFEHLFLKDWDSSREINAYPPATGKYALYKKSSFYSYFDYAANTYGNLDNLTIVPTLRNSTLDFCIESYPTPPDIDKEGENAFQIAYDKIAARNQEPTKKCVSIPDEDLAHFKSDEYLKAIDFDIPWDTLVEMHINFTVSTVTSRQLGPIKGPECFDFRLDIVFDNRDHDGQIPIDMYSTPKRVPCPRPSLEDTTSTYTIRALSGVVAVVCITSFILCCRALIRGQILARETSEFFDKRYKLKLTRIEIFQFLNLWYVVICINDVLIIIGTVLKELIESRRTNSDLWDYCSMFLGIGNLLVWFGMLRYLSFFDKYNVIMLTLRQALPNLIRFGICVSIMYLGFVFCGWVVLGPYQFKFYTLSSTSECLFSLINGDDMYATFSMVSAKSGMIWGFSRGYIYAFVVFFIYVVLSLFISIIMDAYEKVKEHYKIGFPRTRVDDFCKSVEYDVYSQVFSEGIRPSLLYKMYALVMMKRYGPMWKGYARETTCDAQIAVRTDDRASLLT